MRLPIQARREFWDVPRMFVVALQGQQILFDCEFDLELDEYADTYRVFLMPDLSDTELTGSWQDLQARALRELGTITVAEVQFDPTRRESIAAGPLLKLPGLSSL